MNRFTSLLLLVFLTGCMKPGEALAEPSDSKTNVVLVLDVSGSMAGDRITQAKNALVGVLTKLPDDANVGVIQFNGNYNWLVPIGRLNRPSAIAQIRRIGVGGNTAIGDALTAASRGLEQHRQRLGPRAEGAKFQIVLMSDGDNTAGRNPVDAIAEVSQTGQRLDVIGVEFVDKNIRATLARYGFSNAYHEVHEASRLFQTLKQVLNLESVKVSGGGAGDISVLANVPPDVLNALLQAIVAAERKTR